MGVYEKDGETFFGEPEDEGKRMCCDLCGNPLRQGQVVSYEPAANRWTHVEPECKDTKPLKKLKGGTR